MLRTERPRWRRVRPLRAGAQVRPRLSRPVSTPGCSSRPFHRSSTVSTITSLTPRQTGLACVPTYPRLQDNRSAIWSDPRRNPCPQLDADRPWASAWGGHREPRCRNSEGPDGAPRPESRRRVLRTRPGTATPRTLPPLAGCPFPTSWAPVFHHPASGRPDIVLHVTRWRAQ